MKKHTLIFTLLSLFFYTGKIQAQEESLSNYFNDGGISNSKNIVKINTFSILLGDIPITYERIIGQSFGIEVGAGMIIPLETPFDLLNSFSGKGDPTNGYSIWVFPKYYIQHEAPEKNYMGFQYLRRKYQYENHSEITTSVTYNFGLQLLLGKRFIFDYNVGVGFWFSDREEIYTDSRKAGVALPIAIKLGTIF